jgi:hypothetical protein
MLSDNKTNYTYKDIIPSEVGAASAKILVKTLEKTRGFATGSSSATPTTLSE